MAQKRKSLLTVDYIGMNESPLPKKEGKMDPAGVLRDSPYRKDAGRFGGISGDPKVGWESRQDADMASQLSTDDAEDEERRNMQRLGPRSKRMRSLLK